MVTDQETGCEEVEGQDCRRATLVRGWRKVLSDTGTTAWITLVHAAPVCLTGLLLNWAFILASVSPWLEPAPSPGSGPPTSASLLLHLTVMFPIFGIGFPVLYLFLGQKYGTRAGFRHLYDRNREHLHAVLSAWLDRNSHRLPKAEAALALAREAPACLESIADSLPPLLQPLVRRAVRSSSAGERLASLNADAARGEAGGSLKALLLAQLDRQIQNQFGAISPWWLRSLLAGNILAMLAAVYWLR